MNKVCPICSKEIKDNDSKFMFALEKPVYLNIWVHKDCIDYEKLLKLIKNDKIHKNMV